MVRDSITLEETIQFIKQAFEKINPDKTEFRFAAWQVKQLLVWLEDYKQLKSDYADLDMQLRTANTEIDRLQSVSSWIPCSERMPDEPGIHVLATDGIRIMESWYEIVEGIALWVDNYTMYVNVNFGEVTHWMPLPEVPQRKDDTHDND